MTNYLDVDRRAEMLADLIRDAPLNGELEAQIRHVFRQIEQQVRVECAEMASEAGNNYLARAMMAAGPGGREMERWGSVSTLTPDNTGLSGHTGGAKAGQVMGYRTALVLHLLSENGQLTTKEVQDLAGYNTRVSAYQALRRLAASGRVERVDRSTWAPVEMETDLARVQIPYPQPTEANTVDA